ncbi:aspartic proteinase nepenthesin-1 [Zea mays]|jgi:hypothetical protein|uniref:Eukaryotic aspartyl protease family protein n=1 Tax=Zea mays TaxID=4577 RepID=K7VQU3_MAIZE|nr:aspartic proteinase nepenthesin-1 [Zea mays]AQL01195.1 Eukaryotic aspartyl protease family protein [Zea mays]|eukprot:XP_008659133.1 aspartic proteinase nepenthesin-1 [Zea mays]
MKRLVALLVLIALPVRAVPVSGAGVVALLTHADAGRGLASAELVRRMAHRTRARRRLLSSHRRPARARVRAGLGAGGGIATNEYLVRLAVGTPRRPVALTLDTGSDLVWTQCAPCRDCFDQDLPVLDPAASSTYAALPCGAARCRALPFTSCGVRTLGNHRSCIYAYHYGDKSLTVGEIATDRFTFGDSGGSGESLHTRRLTFGCGHLNKGVFQSNETGIAGFGRGRWSLPSQLNVTSFSYCFTSMFESKSSLVTLGGSPAALYSHAHSGEVRTTPILKNPSQPSLYFLSLKGISVGKTRLPVPETKFRSTIIDSGASITTLPEEVYEAVKAEFAAQVGLPPSGVEGSALDLCFALPVTALWRRPAVPSLTLHLEGADWELPRSNYVFEDLGARVMCIVLDAAPGEQTVIGNFQQQNTHVVYDLENDRLSFAPARCDRLVASL